MKVHYLIDGYITSDEHKVDINTYKFQSLGRKDKIHVWIAIDSYHGIGTETDEYGSKDREEALMRILSFINTGDSSEFRQLYTDNFEEVLEARAKIKEKLERLLKSKIKPFPN